jgi:hypothetical protein
MFEQGSANSVPISSLPSSPTQGVFREPSIFIALVFIFLQIPFPATPFVSHPYKTPGGVGWSTPIPPPDSLQHSQVQMRSPHPERHCGTCKRATAPFSKYLWNEHLQKCVKTKDFNYLQNEHLRKTRGEGPHLSRPLVFVGGTASTYPMLALAASHALRFCGMLLPVISSEPA